jgi:hypothetical protein
MVTASSGLTRPQADALRAAERSTNGLLVAEEHLYSALRRPQPGRERRWAEAVVPELESALRAIQAHRLEVEGPSGLYHELQLEAPWAVPRVRQLAAQLARIEAETIDLQIELVRAASGDTQAVHLIRADTERILLSMRDALGKEADLVYERFHEPAALD